MGKAAIFAGVGLGLQVLGALFMPVEQPAKLDDTYIQKSAYGTAIPKFWGRFRAAGNIVWAPEMKRQGRRGKKSGGGKKRGPTYTASFALLVGQGPVHAFTRIWISSELKFNCLFDTDSDSFNNSQDLADDYINFWYGTGDQPIDPLIESVEGSSNSFAYRHRAGFSVTDLPVEDYGNRVPPFSVEVATHGTTDEEGRVNPDSVALSEIVGDICRARGLTDDDFDASELSDIFVLGFAENNPGPGLKALQDLAQIYHFFLIDTGWKLRFIKQRRPAPIYDIPREHMGAFEYVNSPSPIQPFEEQEKDALELPKEVTLTYFDISRNHEQNTVRGFRDAVAGNENKIPLNLQIVLRADQAQAAVDRILHLSWIRNRTVRFTLSGIRYAALEVGDEIRLNLHGYWENFQIMRCNLGANFLMEIEAESTQGANTIYDKLATAQGDPLDLPVNVPGPIDAEFLDIPLVNDGDQDLSLLCAATGERWNGAAVWISRDGGASYQFLDYILQEALMGTCNTVLPDYTGDFDTIDSGTALRVTVNGELESISETRMRNGENVALVGNEIIRFKDAGLVSTGVYDITNRLRGRRGTDWARGSHASNERFILLQNIGTEIAAFDLEASDIGQTLLFKVVPPGKSVLEVSPQSLTYNAVALECYSPVQLGATKDRAGKIRLFWTPRDRRAGDRTDYANFPMSEVYVRFDVEILNGGTVVRTYSDVTATSQIYSDSEQIADFGSLQSTVTFRVYQRSALVGRGYPATATITPSIVAATPQITDFSPRSGEVGTQIRVYGAGLTDASSLTIGGTAATGLTVISDSEVRGTIANSTTTGVVSVTTPGGAATTTAVFTITTAGSYTDEQAQDAAASLFTSGIHAGISFTYDDVGNKINATVTGGSSSFNPLNERGLIFLADPNSGIGTSGSNIAWVENQAGQAHFNSIGGTPTLQTNIVNSLPVFRFTGTSGQFIRAWESGFNMLDVYNTRLKSQSLTVFVVFSIDDLSVVRGLVDWQTTDSNAVARGFRVYTSGAALVVQTGPDSGSYAANGVFISTATLAINTWYLAVVTYRPGGPISVWINSKTQDATVFTPTLPQIGLTNFNGVFLGNRYMSNGVVQSVLDGDIAYAGAYSRILSAADREALIDFLASRFAITLV